MNSDHKSHKKNITRTNKKQSQEHHDLKSTTNSTRSRSENKNVESLAKFKWKKQVKEKIGESIKERTKQHEQIQMEKAGERKNRDVNRRKYKAGNDI